MSLFLSKKHEIIEQFFVPVFTKTLDSWDLHLFKSLFTNLVALFVVTLYLIVQSFTL